MTIPRFLAFMAVIFLIAVVVYVATTPKGAEIALVGILTGNEVIVSPKIAGRIERLLVDEGSEVKQGQLIAELDRAELEAQRDYYVANTRSLEARVGQVKNTWGWTNDQTEAALNRAEASFTATKAQLDEARADLWRNELEYKRTLSLFGSEIASAQDRDRAEAALRASQARVKSLEDQVKAQAAEVAVARANRKQLDVQQSDLASTRAQLQQARASKAEAETRLGYTQIFAPLSGIVSVRVARQGEVVQAGGPVVTIIDIDHLWVHADVEETYVDSIHFGDRLKVRLPSGDLLEGTVFFKGVENEFATQRDVSRTKRDIKTFAIKVALPNPGRRLFAGMTAVVLLPPPAKNKSWFARWRESAR
jgi:multidrug resistance efflux pump